MINGKPTDALREVSTAEIDRCIRTAKAKLQVESRAALLLKALGEGLVKAPDFDIDGYANDEQCGVLAGIAQDLPNAEIAAIIDIPESRIPKVVSSISDQFDLPRNFCDDGSRISRGLDLPRPSFVPST